MENPKIESEKETPPIPLELSLDEINLILKALSEQPFKEVYELVGKIHAQASEALKGT